MTTAEADDFKLPTRSEVINAQNKDNFGNQMKQVAGTPNSNLTFEKNGLLVRQIPPDGSIRKLVSLSLSPILLYFVH